MTAMGLGFLPPKSMLYLKALRPWSLAISLTPIILGTMLAYKLKSTFDLPIVLLTTLTVLCIHSAGNLVNTYYDFKRGIDNKRSDDRTLVDQILTPNDVVWFGGVLYTAACLFFLILASISPARIEMLSLVYFGGMSFSFLYTGGIGLKYMALGDIAIIMTFGPLVVIFAYLAQCGGLSMMPVIYAIPLALHTEAVLHANNVRDMKADESAGIITFAILIGPVLSYIVFCILLFVPYIMLFICTMNWASAFALPLLTIVEAFRIEESYRRSKSGDTQLPHRMARLGLFVGLCYVAAIATIETERLPFYRSLREIF